MTDPEPATPRRLNSESWIGLVGVILGAVITAIPSCVIADKQIEANEQTATSSFLRDERRVAYAEYLADHQTLRDAEYALAVAVFTAIQRGQIEEERKAEVEALVIGSAGGVEERYSELLLSASTLKILGSSDVIGRSVGLNREHQDLVENIVGPEYVFAFKAPGDVLKAIDVAVNTMDEELLPQFLTAVGQDFDR